MNATGWWTGDPPEPAAPAMPVTAMLLGMKQRGAGDVLALAAARSYDRPDEVPDPDERAANLVARGYLPGQSALLAQALADVTAELEAERASLEKAARRQERMAREHAAGRVSVSDIMAMGGADEGDEHRVRQLERRAASLQRQIRDVAEMIAPGRQPGS